MSAQHEEDYAIHDLCMVGWDPSWVAMRWRPPGTLMDLSLTSFLYHSNWQGEWIVNPLLSNSYWCIIPIMGPFGVCMTPPTVPMSMSVHW
jgi:hypothetical protein